jgi:bleomycin hydrolase
MKTRLFYFLAFLLSLIALYSSAQEITSGYSFADKTNIKVSAVENQQYTGTCWSFATTSFIEAELLRMGKTEYNLSEMYFVRFAYIQKGINYVRYHGKVNFGEGGQAHDVINVIRNYGFVPQQFYSGNTYDPGTFNHGELDAMLKAALEVVVSKPNKKVTSVWDEAFTQIVDTYLGKVPQKIEIDGKSITPLDFVKETGFNYNDYVEFTSFTHHPFNQQINLEIPDNWSDDMYYNVSLDDLMSIMNNSLNIGYTFVWDGDVSHPGFSHKNGVAIVPQGDLQFDNPAPEKNITQEFRQREFDNLTTTDDHLMHITGLVSDQNGTIYYKTKNSWGTERNKFGGYLNMSEAFMKLNTVAILVHKNAIPKEIKEKLKIK